MHKTARGFLCQSQEAHTACETSKSIQTEGLANLESLSDKTR